MAFVHKAIDLASTPTNRYEHLCVERGPMAPKLVDISLTTSLATGDVVLRQGSGECHVDLAPTEPMPKGPQNSTDALIVHAAIFVTAAYQ